MSVPLPSGYTSSLLPAISIAVQLGVGAVPASNDFRPVLLGNKTSAGLTPVETVVELYGPDDAATKFGARSELTHMARAWFKKAPRGRVWACAVSEGDTPVAAVSPVAMATSGSRTPLMRTRTTRSSPARRA